MPTLTASYYIASGTSGSNLNTLTTPSFTPAAGDVLIVKLGTWDTANPMNAPTNTGSQTFTQRAVVSPGTSRSWCAIHSCTVSGSPGAMTVSAAPASASMHAMLVERWTSASLAATPVTATLNSSNGTPSGGSITTSAANSAISIVNVDWNSVNPATVAYVNAANVTAENILDAHTSADSVQYYWRQAAPAAGATGFGLTAPAAQNYSMAAIEVLNASAPAAVSPAPRVVSQAVKRAAFF